MTSKHTITLSQRISSQANGIVLVFSAYSSGASQNYQFSCHFIPKEVINLLGDGKGYMTFLGGFGNDDTSGLTTFGSKYLYIYDTQIVGNENNKWTGTGCGITCSNNKYVLRYVIGV